MKSDEVRKTTTEFKLPYRQTYMIVTGTGFASGAKSDNDPNVKINGATSAIKSKVDPTTTKLMFDITNQLSSETDFFGNTTVSQVNLIVKTTAGSGTGEETVSSDNPTITNIEFYQPDLIDACTSSQIKIKRQDSSWESENDNFTRSLISGNKYQLSFTPLADTKEFRFYLSPSSYALNSSNAYVVVETDGNISGSATRKLEYLTFGNTNTASTSSNVGGFEISLTNGHKLIFMNPAYSFESARNALLGSETLSCTKLGFILKSSGTSALNIYRVGMYNIREIQDLYDEVKYYAFTFSALFSSSVGSKQTSMQKTAKISATGVAAESLMLQIKTLGDFNVGSSEIDLRLMTITSGNPTLVDIPSQYSNSNLKYLLSTSNYMYFPTVVNRVRLKDSYYVNYYDGAIAPYTVKWDGNTGDTYYYLHTRKFVEGYSSCCLPFAINTTSLLSNLTAYTFGSCSNEGVVTFTKAGGDIAANTPMIIKADAAGYYLIPASATGNAAIATPSNYYATAASNNVSFVGSFVDKVPDGDYDAAGGNCKNYGITTDGTTFKQMTAGSTKTTYYRAFICDKRGANAAPLRTIVYDEMGTTGIATLREVVLDEYAPVYNLNGVRMRGDNLPKGIYVRNGKKFIVK